MKKLLALLLLTVPALGQGVFLPPQTAFKVVNGYTTPIANATITVCAANASGIPCSPALVTTIFKDAALTQALSNPFLSDAFGNYQFAAAPATYTVTTTAAGFVGNSFQVSIGGAGGVGTGFANLISGNNTTAAMTVSGAASLSVPTATLGTNTTQAASTAFVLANNSPASFTVATLPAAAGNTGKTVAVTDGLTQGSCTVGGGSALAYCRSNGSAWQPLGDGGGANIPITTKGDLFTFSTVNARQPVGSNGQFLTADSTQTTGIKWAPLPQSTTPATSFPLAVTSLVTLGDSISFGFGLPGATATISSNQGWPALFGKMFNASLNSNFAIPGAAIFTPGFADSMYALSPSTAIGTVTIPFSNDYSDYNSGNGAELESALQSLVVWGALPNSAKVLAPSMTQVGSWSSISLFGQTGKFSSTTNDTITGTVNGTSVYISMVGHSGYGSATVLVDSVSQGTISFNTSGYGTGGGGFLQLSARYNGFSTGNHSVQIKVISGICPVFWVAGNQGGAQTPFVGIGAILARSGQTPATVAAQNALTSTMMSNLVADGLNVAFIDDSASMSLTAVPAQVQADLIHPNELGSALIAKAWYEKFTPAQTYPANTGVGGDALAQILNIPSLTPAMSGSTLEALLNFWAAKNTAGGYVAADYAANVTIPNGYESDAGIQRTINANLTTTSTANPPTAAIYTYGLSSYAATGATHTWSWSCHLYYQSSVNTAGLILGINSVATPTSILHHARIFSTLTGTSTDAAVTSTTSGAITTLAGANAAASATTYEATDDGTIEIPAAGGNFSINFAATSAATISIMRGSYCRMWFD